MVTENYLPACSTLVDRPPQPGALIEIVLLAREVPFELRHVLRRKWVRVDHEDLDYRLRNMNCPIRLARKRRGKAVIAIRHHPLFGAKGVLHLVVATLGMHSA